jgi:hypothetical protein
MRLPRVRSLLPALLAAFAAAGCGESSTLPSEELQGTFVLETFRGGPVPARVETESFTYHVIADTIRLETRTAGTQIRAFRVDFHDPARPDDEQVLVQPFEYRVRDGRLAMSNHCPLNALCVGPYDVGTHEGDALFLDFGDGALQYRRIED